MEKVLLEFILKGMFYIVQTLSLIVLLALVGIFIYIMSFSTRTLYQIYHLRKVKKQYVEFLKNKEKGDTK